VGKTFFYHEGKSFIGLNPFGKKKSLPAYFGILEKNITFYVPQLGNHSPCDIVHNHYE